MKGDSDRSAAIENRYEGYVAYDVHCEKNGKVDGALESLSVDWIVPFLLLGLRERNFHGYELTRRIADLGFGATRLGTVYRTLRQMEEEGMVASEGDGLDSRLSRRRYSITGSGEAYLEFWAGSLAWYRKEIDLFFQLYNKEPTPGGCG